ncbi:hypothetical protein cyc_02252 [Cyclospora cayetanensis]|uniref:DUF676 domain-containing protein n=1 Tax=Cyclospora cayetanensis TaxID=88456 RepID=A0A1D3D177_9EIME|nr:hypothetical protein cyc_02252 [Cyclospora cayetanensis]
MPTCFPRLLKASPGRKRRFYEGWVPYSLGSARTGATGAVEREAYEGHWATVYRQRFDLGISSADSICIPLYLRLRGEDSRAKWRAARLRREGVKKGGWVVWISEDTGYLYATTVAQWTHSNRQQWHDECRERCDQRCALASRVQTATAKSSCDINKSSGGSNAKGNNGEQTTDSRRSSGAKGLPSTERRILNLLVLLHGMSPPAVLQTDVVENFGNLLATILERFPTNQKQKQSFLSSSALSAETACVGSGAGNVDPTDAGGPLEGSHLPPGTTSAYATAGASSKGVLSCQDSTTAYPATLLFLIYSYRDATWQSVAACMARIVPLLADELQVLLQHWDEVRLFAVGHSLGGLLWRFVMLRRLQQLLFPPSNKQATGPAKKASAVPDCYNTLLKALQHPKLRLETFCTLASPHVGAYKSSAVYRSMPRAVAGLRFLPNSNYAQDLLLQSDKGVLAALAEEERAGRSHMTYPFSMSQDDACSAKMFQQSSGILNFQPSTGKNTSKIFQEQGNTTNEPQQHGRTRVLASCGQTSQSATLSSPPQAFEAARETHVVPGEVPILAVNRFKRVVLYGIYETDWIVSANSALATAADLRKTPEGRVVTQRPMYPVRLKSATANSACTIIFRSPRHHRSCKYGIRNSTSKCNTELLLAQQHIDVFNHVSFIERETKGRRGDYRKCKECEASSYSAESLQIQREVGCDTESCGEREDCFSMDSNDYRARGRRTQEFGFSQEKRTNEVRAATTAVTAAAAVAERNPERGLSLFHLRATPTGCTPPLSWIVLRSLSSVAFCLSNKASSPERQCIKSREKWAVPFLRLETHACVDVHAEVLHVERPPAGGVVGERD